MQGWERAINTPYQSEDPRSTIPTHRMKEEKWKTGDKRGARKGIKVLLYCEVLQYLILYSIHNTATQSSRLRCESAASYHRRAVFQNGQDKTPKASQDFKIPSC